MCAGHGLGGRRERAPGDDDDGKMRSFPPPPPFLVERYCPTVDLDNTHTHTLVHSTGFRTDFHDADTTHTNAHTGRLSRYMVVT